MTSVNVSLPPVTFDSIFECQDNELPLWTVAREVCHEFGLSIPEHGTLELAPAWGDDNRGYLNFSLQYDKLPAIVRRKIKSIIKLDVPDWMKGNEWNHKDLTGSRKCCGFTVYVSIQRAYVCEVDHTVEVEAPDANQEKASVIDSLTPEQLVYLAKLEAAKLRAPRQKNIYRCHPSDQAKSIIED